MPTGPRGQKRPADVIGNALKLMKIATGEKGEDILAKPAKNEAAAEMGRKGAASRAPKLTLAGRAEIARTAAAKPEPYKPRMGECDHA